MGHFDFDLFGGESGVGRLNFEPDEFHSEAFSVDSFIQQKRQTVPLDVLRDDLGVYLKSLRSSLIELINQDYGQFVNLSSNLVGLDGRIQSIVLPLSRTRNDLQDFMQLLNSSLGLLLTELETRKVVRDGKAQLHHFRKSFTTLESAEKLITKLPPEITSACEFNLLRSTCDEVAESSFLLQCSPTSPLKTSLLSRWLRLKSCVLERTNYLFKIHVEANCVSSSSTGAVGKLVDEPAKVIKSLLYMYSELQCETIAEELLVKEVLGPKCEDVLKQKGNIGALFDMIESFLTNSALIQVWQSVQELPWIAQYDFIGRAVFPHVYAVLCKHFPHIWSPSNPDLFHSNWSRCEAFINSLEKSMPSTNHFHHFRQSETLKDFYSKWQFPVYFQLRFHSLVMELEAALDDVSSPCSTPDFKFDSTRVMIKVLNQCWDKDKIYIRRISGRFLKASALIVSRYIKEVHLKIAMNKSTATQNALNAYCDLTLAELFVSQILQEKIQEDLNAGQNAQGKSIASPPTIDFLTGFSWKEAREAVEDNLVDSCISQSSNSISSVNDIPRLYRRTNREAPSKPLEYIDTTLLPVISLKRDVYNAHQQDLWDRLQGRLTSTILQRYKALVQDVLLSVQRMEESLKRLKKVKGQNQFSGGENNKGLSDDDKIRSQIQLDVNYFVQKMKELSPAIDTSEIQIISGIANGK